MIHLLSKSEDAVIELKCLGKIEKEIAKIRFVSLHTIKSQVKNAIKKTGVSNGYELVARYAATHPNLFRNVIVGVFVSIQSMLMGINTDIDKKRSRRFQSRTQYGIARIYNTSK